MSKKFVFSVAVKSRKKMVFFEVNNVTNVMFAVVNFRQGMRFLYNGFYPPPFFRLNL